MRLTRLVVTAVANYKTFFTKFREGSFIEMLLGLAAADCSI